jgi:hypothetical protein
MVLLFGCFERIEDRGLYQIWLFELFWNPWLWCSQKGGIYEFQLYLSLMEHIRFLATINFIDK